MNIYSSTFLPIMMIKDDGKKYFPHNNNGYNTYMLPSKAQELLTDLMNYCENYTDDEIEKLNQQIIKDVEKSLRCQTISNKSKKSKSGYIYILQCADKYKIGYSKNVEQRMHQLDTRPFKLELLLKCYSERAYDIEQELHKQLVEFKADGEWYNESLSTVNVKELIMQIVEVLGCDTQF